MIKNPFLKRLSTKKFQLNQLKIGLVTILRVTKSILNYPERWGLGFTLTIKWPLLYLVQTKLTQKSFSPRVINHAKFQLNTIRNGWVMVPLEILQRCMEYCSAAGSLFWIYRLDPFHLESNHAKFQLNPLRNGWDIANTNICSWWSGGWVGGVGGWVGSGDYKA